ncbi:MAG TPA: sigma-70 family RNA polymerase sigma factor [Planctomycetota bacterium]|nr:sigma-70 family RNA polymerase sigma factor [Planctomycetota bacterium]
MNEDLERSLIARFQKGDESAYAELFDAHHRRITHLGLQILRNEESALDAAQEVFMRAFQELAEWRGEARFSTWLYRTALNVCFERIRAEEKQRKIRDAMPERDLADSPEVHAVGSEIGAAIDNAVKQLPPRQRAIFALKQYEEMRFSEIATLLDITEGGAKASYHKALLALRERLKNIAPEGVKVDPDAEISAESEALVNDAN